MAGVATSGVSMTMRRDRRAAAAGGVAQREGSSTLKDVTPCGALPR